MFSANILEKLWYQTFREHLDFWLSVNLFARGGAYDTFPEVAIISRLHLTTPVQRHS
jgi:hypothetical protein